MNVCLNPSMHSSVARVRTAEWDSLEGVGGVLSVLGLETTAGPNAYVRPAVSVTTGGVANVPVSIAEDLLATLLSILAIVVPVVVAVVLILLTAFVIWLLWRRARRSLEALGG